MGSQAASKHSAVSLLTWHARLKPPPLRSPKLFSRSTGHWRMSLTVVGNISRAGQVELSASISVYYTHFLQLFTVHSCVGLQSCQTQDITFSIFRCCSCSTLINPVSRTRIIVRAWDFPFLSSNLAVTVQTESSPLRNISHRSAVLMYHRLTVTFFLIILVPGGRCV